MKRLLALISLVLALATLLCACDGNDAVTPDTSDMAETTAETEKTANTTSAPKAENKAEAVVDFSKEYTVKATHLEYMDMSMFRSVAGGDYKYHSTQGGCVVGEYLYTCVLTDGVNPAKCCIVKTNMETGIVEQYSKEFEYGHANDATYNPDDNTIVVNFCDGTTRFAILDADTLQQKRIVEAVGGNTPCSIDYDEVNKRYIAVEVQGRNILIYSKSFKLLKTIPAFITKRDINGRKEEFSMQGVYTDGVYAYILEWHGGSRWKDYNKTIEEEVIANFLVFNLETGKYVDTINTGIKREIEHASFQNGKFYVGCNNINWNGMELYSVEITPKN